MLKKHPTCRWRSEKVRSRKYFILVEGYDWIKFVYFEKEKSLIDADVEFFETRIKLYEDFLKVEHNENWWNEDMTIKQCHDVCDKIEDKIKNALGNCTISIHLEPECTKCQENKS